MPLPLTDDELFAAPPQAHTLAPMTTPVAAPAPLPVASPRGLSDADVFDSAPAEPAAPTPSFGERLFSNLQEGFKHSLLGAAGNFVDRSNQEQIIKNLREQGQTEAADRYEAGLNQPTAADQRYANMPAWNAQGSTLDKAAAGAASLGGQIFGGALSPEGLITRAPGVGTVIERIAPKVVEKVLPKAIVPAATRVVEAGANQAVVNTVTDPVVQGVNIAAKAQDHYDPVQTALAPALGFLIGGTVHGATEMPGGLKGLADSFRAWRDARGTKAAPDAPPSPQEVSDFEASPELQAHMAANGITDPKDPRFVQLQDRLAQRRGTEAVTVTGYRQDAGGASTQAFHADQARLANERGAVAEGDMHPAAASTAGRVPREEIPPVVPVSPAGQADVGDLGVRAGIDKAATVKADVNQKASEAFTLAQRQRERAGADVRDTQPAGRPDGADQQQVVLDEGFPVQVQGRKHVDVGGKTVEMATVHRYDPRTGELEKDAVPYDVPVRQLRTGNYAKEPRQAQDFEARAEGPKSPEVPRRPDQAVTREPAQTYRATPADNNADFPGATRPGPEDGMSPDGRSPLPRQPEGPHPGRERPTREEEVIRDFQAREEARKNQDWGGPGNSGSKSREYRGTDDATSSKAKPHGDDGRFEVDDRGFVASDKGGPIRFADQKQAAKWIINEGHKKSPDQIFQIENHPSGKGFTVHERGRSEAKPDNEPPPSDGPSRQRQQAEGARAGEGVASPGAPSPPLRLEGPKAVEPTPEPAPKAKPAPISPEAKAHLDQARKDIDAHRGTDIPKPRGDGSLFDRIRELGGIRADGDVREILQGFRGEKFKSAVMRPDGKSPDEIRRALQEEGWFGGADRHGSGALETGSYPGDDVKDLHDLMEREAGGEKVYHPDRVTPDREHDFAAQQHLDEEIGRTDIQPTDSRAVAARKLAEFRAHQAEAERGFADLDDHAKEDLHDEGYEPGSDVGEGAEEPVRSQNRAQQTDDIPGFESDAGGNDREAGGAEPQSGKGAGDHADEGRGRVDDERQTEVPGTEHEATEADLKARAAKRDAEERQANPRAYSGKKQRGADEGGLFGDQSEKAQDDMFSDPEQRDAAGNLRNKFFSNPLGDPEAWRELGRTLSDTFHWARGEAHAWTQHLHNMMDALPRPEFKGDTRFKRAWNATYPMRKWLNTLGYSNDGRLRAMASGFKSDAMRDIANMFFAAPRGGKEGAVGRDYFQAVNTRRGQWLNALEDALEPFQKMSVTDREAAMNQIGRLVQNPGAIKAGTPIHDAAAAIGKMLKEAHTYLREAGVEVGEVKRGYLPRVENTVEILKDPEGFKAAAKRAYMADGVPPKDAAAAAEAWHNRVMLGDLGINHGMPDFSNATGGGSNTFSKARELSKKADEIMGNYWLRNPADIMPAYIGRAVQKAEWSRRLGIRDKSATPPRGVDAAAWRADPAGKWEDLKARMIAEGNGEHIPDVVKIVKSMTGNMASPAGRGRAAVNFARTWSALTYLPRAVFASLSEPINISLRTGNTLDAGRAYVRTLQHWLPVVRQAAGPRYLRELGHDMGFIGEAIDNITMLQRVGNEDGGRFSRLIQSQFFKRTGLTQLTEANRLAALDIGQIFLRRLASDVTTKSHYNTIARRMLAEMGIGEGKADDFSKWVMALDKPKAGDILDGGEHGEAYHTALGRFVSQSVMAPTGATRAYFAQHPLGGLIYNLQSFNYAFQKNVLNRIGAMTKDALDPKSGLNAHERAYALMPLVNVVPLLMVTYAIGEIRDALFQDPARAGRPDMDFGDKAKRAISRAGITGAMDAPYNAVTGARYQRDPLTAMLGPVVGGADTLVGDGLNAGSDRNSPNTNTFERKAMKDVYQMIVQPTLEAGTLALAPESTALGFGLGTAGIYGFSHPAARERFVRALAGAPLPPR